MELVNLTNGKETIVFGLDSVVIQKFGGGLKGGRALKVENFGEPYIKAGHVILTDGKGEYIPMPVSEGAYGEMPEGFEFAGVLYRTIRASKGDASIMFDGEVNIEAVPYPMDAILEDFKKALPNIVFVKDEPYVSPVEEVEEDVQP